MTFITPPPPAPSRNSPSTFSARMDAFLSWMTTAVPQFNTLALATGPGVFPNSISVTGFITGTAVTQSATDATAGRLLKVGDFGIGTPAGTGQAQVTLNSATVPGLYTYASSDPNAPTAMSGMVEVTRSFTVNIRQEAGTATGGDRWQRRSTDGGATWAPWRRVYNAENVLGTVTQASGVPTGAVIERGSNANGEYVRFADGTQICLTTALSVANISTALGSIFESPSVTWTYPASFAAQPYVTANGGDTRRWGTASHNTGLQTANLRLLSATSVATATNVEALAVGRWF
jgi:hypothetical protein